MPGVTTFTGVDGITMHQSFENRLSIYTSELQQICQTIDHNTIVGLRLQYGIFDTASFLTLPSASAAAFPSPPQPAAVQDLSTYFNRESLYGYHGWQILDSVQLFGGLTCDWMRYPANSQIAPISREESSASQLSPKAGLIYTPGNGTIVRFAYTRSLGGASVDQSYQLEPSQVAGFLQSFRSLVPESVSPESPGAQFEAYGLSLEQKFNSGTYLALSGTMLNSYVQQEVGAFDADFPKFQYAVPSGLSEDLDYHERTLQVTANQLLGKRWSLGAAVGISKAILNTNTVGVPNGVYFSNFVPRQQTEAVLQNADLSANFNHPSGFFGSANALWRDQNNAGYAPYLPGDSFWQVNLFAGYRFFHRKAELRVGLLNLTGQDYNLNPLNLHDEYAHQRTITMRLLVKF
jgi:outer membrane receptor protein involved in Fe transport